MTGNNYSLHGMIDHVGNMRFGHYTATLKAFGGYYYLDDHHFRQIQGFPQFSRQAYILHYQKN